MKCTSNRQPNDGRFQRTLLNRFRSVLWCAVLAGTVLLTGCSSSVGMAFSSTQKYSNFSILTGESGSGAVAQPFAGKLAVADGDVNKDEISDLPDYVSAGLFDVNNVDTLYGSNLFNRVYPASLTKIMTALVALENASTDTMLTATDNVLQTDADAQVAGIKAGDTMTLDQALHLLLIYSANDAAVMIAENVGGSVENFVQMMNDEAKRLGATGTNFVNPNGLSNDNHYTTAYDMYLIFNEALKYDTFTEIINMSTYSTVYHDQNGAEKDITVNSTNMYLQQVQSAPSGVTVIGGKTGTTNAAGHCLILMVRDTSGRPYVAVIMKAYDEDALYKLMNELLALVPST
ncbi:MAG: D-alanyl-D-alanine carboxypeptidase family protein [Lachnospiraceae bacterium]